MNDRSTRVGRTQRNSILSERDSERSEKRFFDVILARAISEIVENIPPTRRHTRGFRTFVHDFFCVVVHILVLARKRTIDTYIFFNIIYIIRYDHRRQNAGQTTFTPVPKYEKTGSRKRTTRRNEKRKWRRPGKPLEGHNNNTVTGVFKSSPVER